MYQDVGQIGGVDSYGMFRTYASNGAYIGEFGVNPGGTSYNTERGDNAGTFLTFGGYSGTNDAGAGQPLYIWSFINYGAASGYTAYIQVNGVEVTTHVHDAAGEQYAFYSLTIASGTAYTVHIGIRY